METRKPQPVFLPVVVVNILPIRNGNIAGPFGLSLLKGVNILPIRNGNCNTALTAPLMRSVNILPIRNGNL